MEFIPETPERAQEVPYFNDVGESDGWRGMATSKNVSTLKSEVIEQIGHLGGMVVGFQQGIFQTDGDMPPRDGFVLRYVVQGPNGTTHPGEMKIAALPCKRTRRRQRSLDTRRNKSLRMALFMLRDALAGARFLQALSPGYAALMPWMIEPSTGKPLTQLWTEQKFGRLLPSPDANFESDEAIEGEFEERS